MDIIKENGIPAVLDHMAVKARDYITSDPNASIIKQGMMLEYLCRGYLDEAGLMDRLTVTFRNPVKPTLDDMLEYLYDKGVIPDDRVNRVVCEAVRRNRNRAVHEFLDMQSTANSTFEPLCRLCRAVHLSPFSFDNGGDGAMSEPEAVYHSSVSRSHSMRFLRFMNGVRMASEEEMESIRRGMEEMTSLQA